MDNRYIDEKVKRKLYAESMGRCMNPNCCKTLFDNGDISEKAHIVPYCDTADNSYKNLVNLKKIYSFFIKKFLNLAVYW